MTPEEKAAQLAKQFNEATDKVKEIAEDMKGRAEKGEKEAQSAKEKADEALLKMNGLKQQVDDLNQRLDREGNEEPEEAKSLGQRLAETDEYKSLSENPRANRSATLRVKEVITSTTTGNGAAGSLIVPDRHPGVVAPPEQRLSIRDLIAAGQTNSNAVEFVQETGFTNGAQVQVTEGDRKGETVIQFGDKTVPVRTIAHFVKASKQVLDDAAMLESYINGRLMYGLKLKEDRMLLSGDGTNGNIEGMIPQATAFADPTDLAEYSIIDQLRLAQLQAVLAEFPASGHVLNPIDWARIELTKDGENRYIIGQPQGNANPRLWGLPVVETQAIANGKFLTGAFSLAVQIFDRMEASIAVSTENEDDFIRNLVTILCEERLAMAVYRPEALVYGTLAAKVAA